MQMATKKFEVEEFLESLPMFELQVKFGAAAGRYHPSRNAETADPIWITQ
jgi:hypothetical protein